MLRMNFIVHVVFQGGKRFIVVTVKNLIAVECCIIYDIAGGIINAFCKIVLHVYVILSAHGV